MSAKGYGDDNAFMETWFKTSKAEEMYLTEYETIEDVLKAVPRFIEAVYSDKRIHSSLNYFSPEEFKQRGASRLLKKHGVHPVMQLPGKPSNERGAVQRRSMNRENVRLKRGDYTMTCKD